MNNVSQTTHFFNYKILNSTEKPPERSEPSESNTTKDRKERVTEIKTNSYEVCQNGFLDVSDKGNGGFANTNDINNKNAVLKKDVKKGTVWMPS